MSSEISIKVEGLSKCYEIYEQPRDRLKQFVMPALRRAAGKLPNQYFREFWALKDVAFEVRKGETVGIIGRNGSGKSTLLQIICGTLNPTDGNIQTHGRVAALLELGSGFNPEFSGRENVYMNGAVLGLTQEEISQRFDAIVQFADIGDFIEQPVKTYSSGMYVRLAFAVIAHVDAEILIIDEALAVGDAVFTQKCMRFLRAFKKQGTLIFVSHDMASVLNLCERAIWLHEGRVRHIGSSKEVSESYLQYTLQEVYGQEAKLQKLASESPSPSNTVENKAEMPSLELPPTIDYGSQLRVSDNLTGANGWKSGSGEILSVRLEHVVPSTQSVFTGGEQVRLVIRATTRKKMESPILGFLVRDRLGQDLFGENTLPFTNIKAMPTEAGSLVEAKFCFRLPMLPNGQYSVMCSFADGDLNNNVQHHWLHDALIFTISSSKIRWGLVGINFESAEMVRCS